MCCVRQTHSGDIKHTYHVKTYAQKYVIKHNYHKTPMKKIGQNFSHKRYHFNSTLNGAILPTFQPHKED